MIVKPAPFAYAKARSLDHALELVASDAEGAKILAGGQSLIATLNMRLSTPRLLIDINGLNELKTIRRLNGQLEIESLMKCTEPSANAKFAPPGWKLEAPSAHESL